MATPIP
jgi:hypothetical protein